MCRLGERQCLLRAMVFFASYGDDENQTYRRAFNGTSSASALTAGVVTLMQSYARATLKTNFSPSEMRAFLKQHGNPQTGSSKNIGPAVALDLALPALPDRGLDLELDSISENEADLFFLGASFPYVSHSSDDRLCFLV